MTELVLALLFGALFIGGGVLLIGPAGPLLASYAAKINGAMWRRGMGDQARTGYLWFNRVFGVVMVLVGVWFVWLGLPR